MIHYELILLYCAGITPKDCVRNFGYSRGAAYRFHRIYRDARKRAAAIILHGYSVSPSRDKKPNNLGVLTAKKRGPRTEKKPVLIRKDDGSYEKIIL